MRAGDARGAGAGGRGAVLPLLGPALLPRRRVFGLPALLVPIQGVVTLAPESSQGWGAVGVFAAFVVVSLGVALSLHRDRVLAWLEGEGDVEGEGQADDVSRGQPVPRRPRRPESWYARAAFATGLAAAVALAVLPAIDIRAPAWAQAWTLNAEGR